MNVECYKNLNKNCYSVRQKGKVILYSRYLILENCRFVVQPAGRKRVLEKKVKNVHAFVRGCLISTENDFNKSLDIAHDVSYNPYRFDYFYFKSSLEPVYEARLAILNPNSMKIICRE